MRKLKIMAVIVLMSGSMPAFNQVDNIYAEVRGDTVTLWQTNAWRNCGALYQMEIEQDGFNLAWYQNDTGQAAYCMCYFNLSVTFILTAAGSYHADVYYTESFDPDNPIYQGYVDFVAGNGSFMPRSGIIGQFQSECFEYNGAEGEVLR